MSNCLTDFISIKGCSNELPEAGFWLNDLPGISNEFLDNIATSDQVTFKEVWNSVQRVVYEQIKTVIRQALYDFGQVELDQVLFETNRINIFDRQIINPVPASAVYKGIFISAFGSKYLQANLKTVYVYNSGPDPVTEVPVKVFNTFDWSVLYETTIDLVSGFNSIALPQSFPVQFNGLNLFFAVDTTAVPTIDNPFTQDYYYWGASDCACANQGPNHSWNYEGFTLYPAIMPLDVALPDKMNFDWSQSGVYFDIELVCSAETFICQNKQHLKMGIAYSLAHQILLNKLAGFRQNFHATYNPEQTEKTLATFEQMRDKEFKNWAKIIKVQGNDLCFNCDEAMMVQQVGVRS
jgi:hypothetical protein